MECQHATELIISAADGELVDAALLTEARMHCVTCPHCRAVERLLEREPALQSPKAPVALVSRIESAAAEIALEHREAAAAPAVEPTPATPSPTARRRWVGIVALASTAAVLFVGLSVGALMIGMFAGHDEASETVVELREDPAAEPEAGAAGTQDTLAAGTQESVAPAYVVFDGVVYVQSAEAVPSLLATAGTVVSDLGTGSSGEHAALSEPGTTDPLFVQGPSGGYMSFSRVTRTLAQTEYALASDAPVTHFGRWPTLPSAYGVPENADGSPTFTERGFDDHGQPVFAPATRVFDGAFAIAPGTGEGDPAAGNPNWTWWVKVE